MDNKLKLSVFTKTTENESINHCSTDCDALGYVKEKQVSDFDKVLKKMLECKKD